MTAAQLDAKYYDVVPPRSFGERLVVAARARMYRDFIRLCRPDPDSTILDLGVSDVVNDAANGLERLYPYPSRITAAGIGAAAEFCRAFPEVRYVQIEANARLPFPDGAFEIATSNAVLEHVGSQSRQLASVRELCRVARTVFVTVPHRYFPVEHHTAIPLLHFWDRSFGPACRVLGKAEWAETRNLVLMSKGRLAATVPEGVAALIGTTGIPLGPFSSNLFLYIDQGSRE